MKTIDHTLHEQKKRPVFFAEQPIRSERTIFLALLALTLAPAAIAMTEEVPIGLLPEIAHELQVSLSEAGMLVTIYALGVVIGTPLLAILTTRFARKPLLLGAIALYLIGNLLNVVVPTYNLLLLVRFLTALAHGVIFSESYLFAAQLAPQKKAQAIAMIFGGFTIATVLGVPGGTWLGQTFGWRIPFLVITGLGIGSLWAVWRLVPSITQTQALPLGEQIRLLARVRTILPLLITVAGCGGIFGMLTYITPLLKQVSGFPSATMSVLLLLFGLVSMGGNLLGGRLTDWRLFPSLLGLQILQVVMVSLFSLWGENALGAVIILSLWESAGFAIIAPVQSMAIEQAGAASRLASAFNVAASNLGSAAAAFCSGLVLASPAGLRAVPMVSLSFILIGLGLTIWNASIHKRQRRTTV